jgi:hypothetical protein
VINDEENFKHLTCVSMCVFKEKLLLSHSGLEDRYFIVLDKTTLMESQEEEDQNFGSKLQEESAFMIDTAV